MDRSDSINYLLDHPLDQLRPQCFGWLRCIRRLYSDPSPVRALHAPLPPEGRGFYRQTGQTSPGAPFWYQDNQILRLGGSIP